MDMDKSLDELIDSGRNTKSGVVLRPAHESGTWTHAANPQQHGGGGGYHQHGKGTKGKQQTQTWNNLHAGASGGQQHQNHYHGKGGGAGGGAGNWNNGSPPHHSVGGPGRGAGWNAAPQVGSGWSNLQQAAEQPWHHGGKGQQGKGGPQNWNYAAHHGAGPPAPHHGNYKGGADGHWPGGSPPRPHHLQQGPPGGAGQTGVIRAFDKPRRGFGTGLLGGRRVQERKAARSTQVFFQKTGDLCVKLYDTEVCSFKKPSPKEKRGPVIQLNSGGFHTAETRFIISECLALVDFSIREKHSGVNLQANPNPTSKRLSLTANKNRAASSTDLAATDGGGTPSGPATQSQAGTKLDGSSGEVDDAGAATGADGEEDLQLSSSNGDGAFDEDAVVVAVPMKKRKRAASDEDEGHDDLDFADEEHVEDEELGPDGGESVRKTNSNVESFDGAGGAGDEEPTASSTMKTGTGSADVLAPPTADGMTAALPASGGQTGGEEKAARTAFLKEKLALKRKAEADRLQKHNTTVKGTTTSSTSTGEQPIKSSVETTSSTSAANGNGKKVEVVVASSNKVTLASSKKGEPRKFAPWIVTGKSAAGEIFELDFYDGIEIALPMSFVPLGEFRNSLGSRFAMLAGGDPTAFHASQAPVIVHQRAGPLGGAPPAGAPPRGGGPPPRSAINVLNPAANGGGVAAVVTGSRAGLPPGAVAVQYVNAAGAPVGPPSTTAGALYRLPPGQQVEVLQHQGSAQQQIVHVVDAEELRWDRATAVGPSTDTNAGVRLVSAANVRAAQSSRAGPYSATTTRTKIFENDRILTASRQHQPAAERNAQKPVAVAGARGGTTTTTGSSTSAAPLALQQPGGAASGRGAVPVVHRAPPEHTPYTVIQTVVNPDGSTTQYRAIHQTAAPAGSTAIQLPPGAAVGATAGTAVHQSARRATTTGAATYRIVQHANAHAAAIGSNGSIMQGAVVQPEQSKSVSKKRAAGAEVPVVAVMPDKTFVPQFQ